MKRLHIVPALAGDVVREVFRRKEFYVVLILGAGMVALLGSVQFFGGITAFSHVKETAVHLVLLATVILSVTVGARQLPREQERRTLFTLLAKPVTRGQLLAGKWLGCFAATGLGITLFWGLFLGMVAAREVHPPAAVYLQAYLFFLALAAVCVSLSLFFSTFLTYSANLTVCLLLCPAFLWWGGRISRAVAEASMPLPARTVLLHVLPHLEFFDLRTAVVHRWDPLGLPALLAVLAYAATYSLAVMGGARAVFGRKALAGAR